MLKANFSSIRWPKILCIVVFLTVALFVLSFNSFFNHENKTTVNSYQSDPSVHSLCSAKADERGLNQNVVSYSLYGPFTLSTRHFTRYVSRLKENAERIKDVYRGWIMRIYIQSTSSPDPRFIFFQEYFHEFPHVDVCNATRALESQGIRLDVFPVIWRFLPLLDPTVNRIMSRDTDSLVLDREVDAVNEWLQSGTSFHIMRDYVGHCLPILAGMWGANLENNRDKVVKSALSLFNDPRLDKPILNHEKGLDQELLETHIWPTTANDSVSHDSYCCEDFGDRPTRPFPTQRKGDDYVGKIHNGPPKISKLIPCPDACKPSGHLDWIYC